MKLKPYQCACGQVHQRPSTKEILVIDCPCGRRDRCWPPTAGAKPDPVHDGFTWRHMPGTTPMDRRMSFSLFKRGQLSRDYITTTHKQRAVLNVLGTGLK